MALVKYGGGIIQMSGSIAGNTHARNRSGNYVRARTKPTNPNSPAQNKIRSVITYLSELWADTLDDAQRLAWKTYADNVNMKNRLGEVIHLSGFNHFIRSNSVLLYNNKTLIAPGPTNFLLPEKDPGVYVQTGESNANAAIYFDTNFAWVSEDNAFLLVLQGIPQNGHRNFFGGPWHSLAPIAGISSDGPTSPQQVPLFWPVAEGQKIWFKFRIARPDGRLSEPWMASSIASL